MTRSSPLPSVQYDRPRPESCRGAHLVARSPSSMPYIHFSSPVFASSATTERRVPAVAYSIPLTMSGVPSSLVSGRGPRLSVLNRHATSSLLKLLALTCSSGEYLLPRRSAVYIGHSPFFVLGIGLPCPESRGVNHATPATSNATAGTTRNAMRFIRLTPGTQGRTARRSNLARSGP